MVVCEVLLLRYPRSKCVSVLGKKLGVGGHLREEEGTAVGIWSILNVGSTARKRELVMVQGYEGETLAPTACGCPPSSSGGKFRELGY